MKCSFLIAAHAQPALLARLVARLRHPDASIFIHIDKATDIRPFRELFAREGISDIHWAPRVQSAWGTFGQVRATLSLLREALKRDRESARFVLLSGQDYPIVPSSTIIRFFANQAAVNFISSAPLPRADWIDAGGFDRLRHWHFLMGGWRLEYPSNPVPVARRLLIAHRLCEWLLPPERPLPKNLALHGGGNWWNLTREAVEGVLEYLRTNPSFLPLFRFSRSADEVVFQTILMNSGPWPIENNDLRSVFWDGRNNEFPAFVTDADFEAIAASGALFVRKIHPTRSSDLLDRIDRELLGC